MGGTARLEEGGCGLSRGVEGIDARARAAPMGDDAEQSRHSRLVRSGSGRAGRSIWTRRSRPFGRHCKNTGASACRSTGRRRRTISASRFELGERESGTARLEEAVAAYRDALKEWTRERVPLDWAMTQNNLGNALETLGERESGTARLEEAVAAYREALQEWTRERVPLDWAMTQNNLGIALQTLGERESGTARLEEAVAAYRDGAGGIRRASACRSTGR